MNIESLKPAIRIRKGIFQFNVPRIRLWTWGGNSATLGFGFKGRDIFLKLNKSELDDLIKELTELKIEIERKI